MSLNDWFRGWKNGVFGTDGTLRKRNRRRRPRHFRRQPGQVSLAIEPLEERAMLSAISWVNRGTATTDSDNFASVFGSNAFAARRVVDAAIDAWERVIVDFNYSDGSNTFNLTVNMNANGSGHGGLGGVSTILDGKPTAGSISIARGFDGPDADTDWVDVTGDGIPDPRGDGIGWFLDPTPNDQSEFQGNIVNAYAGNAQAGSPALGLRDLYTVVVAEMTHALGLATNAGLLYQTGNFLTNTMVADDSEGGGTGFYWVFNSPAIKHLMTSYNSGDGGTDFGPGVHSAGPPKGGSQPLTFNGENYIGADDTGNASYEWPRRYLVPNTMRLILGSAYGFQTVDPAQFGTMYASLNESTGELLIRGGEGASDDVINVSYVGGSEIVVTVDIGSDVPGTGPLPGAEDLPAFQSRFRSADINSIRIEAGDGSDRITVDVPASLDSTIIRGEEGDDHIVVNSYAGLAGVSTLTVDGGDDADTIIIGGGDFNTHIFNNVTVTGGAGVDKVEILSTQDAALNSQYTITTTQFREESAGGRSVDLQGIEKFVLNAGPHEDLIDIQSTNFDTTVNGNGGADTFNVGDDDYSQNIRGTIFLNGASLQANADEDVLNISTKNDSSFVHPTHRITDRTYLRNADLSKLLTFVNMDRVGLDTSDGRNSFFIVGTAAATELTINAGDDRDEFFIAEGDYISEILGPITLHAGGGDDELFILDGQAAVGYSSFGGLATDEYWFDATDYDKVPVTPVEANTFRKSITVTLFGSDTINGPLLKFDGVSDVTLSASGLGDFGAPDFATSTIYIDGLATGTELTINGGNGDDKIVVGGGNYQENIRGSVDVRGGTGEDELIIDDSLDAAGLNVFVPHVTLGVKDFYSFDATTFQKIEEDYRIDGSITPRQSPILTFDSISELTLQASGTFGDPIPDTRIQVDETANGTNLILNGNEGGDQYYIDAPGLNSDVVIRGGPPSSAPGDSLTITGTPTSTAVYTPDLLSPSAGVVDIEGHDVRFSGLEPVSLENFDSVTFVTPRSYDVINVAAEADGWTRISGSSGHPALPLPFESLSFRDVRNVTLDTGARDLVSFQFPPGPNAITYPPYPHDVVTMEAGALDARGLESFSVVTGPGVNQVYDHSLESGTPVAGRLNVDGLGGTTLVSLYGASSRADVEQFSGRQAEFTAYDADGNAVYNGGFFSIELLDMSTPWDTFRAIGENIDRTFSGTTTQTISGSDLTTVSAAPGLLDSQLEIVALGNSRIELLGIPFAARTISGIRSAGPQPEPPVSPDNVTVGVTDLFAAGPQPEPPLMRVVGYGPEDQLNVEGATLTDGTPLPTDFEVSFDESGNENIELLIDTGGLLEEWNFRVAAGDMGALPALGLTGDATVENNVRVVRPVAFDPIMLLPQPVDIFYVNSIDVSGTTDPEGLTAGTREDGGLQIDSVHLNDIGRDLHLMADATLTTLRYSAGAVGDRFEFVSNTPNFDRDLDVFLTDVSTVQSTGTYSDEMFMLTESIGDVIGIIMPDMRPIAPSFYIHADAAVNRWNFVGGGGREDTVQVTTNPAFHDLTTSLADVELFEGYGDNVIQTLTPTAGSVRVGAFLATHDAALTSTTLEASSFDVLVTRDALSDTFHRDLSLNYAYLGSEGKYVVKDVKFAGKFDLTVEHKDGATNTTTIQEKDVVYEQKTTTKIIGAEGGDDQVLVTKAGVETKDGSTLDIDLKTGDDLVVVTETDSGPAEGTKDEILVKGSGDDSSTGEVKSILVHKQQDATPEEQLTDLEAEKPEYAAKIEAVKASADQPLLAKKGTPKPDEGDTTVDYKGEATKFVLFVKNADAKLVEASVKNPGGTTQIEKVGNVEIRVPDLDGTGIDPTQPFTTFTVVNTLDAGNGSLRAAIEAANAFTGDALAVITYDIPASDPGYAEVDAHLAGGDLDPDVFVISPLTALPALVRGNIVINGQSQHGLTGDTNPFGPEIVLAGNLAGATVNGLHLASLNNVIHGLNIQQFSGNGVLITADENTLTGNYVGTNATGDSATANADAGVQIVDSSGNVIGGTTDSARNVISGNTTGVRIAGPQATDNQVAHNFIGLAADGLTDLGNDVGVVVAGTPQGNRIGGPTQDERNIISGNGLINVHLAGTLGTTVQGNYIGTDRTGTQVETVRTRENVRVENDRNSVIGGTEPEAGNVIAGGTWGVYLVGHDIDQRTEGTRIQGNRIGTTADGESAGANVWGIYVDGFHDSQTAFEVHDIQIGGDKPGSGNLISGNQNEGVLVRGPGAQGIRIQGNLIGIDIDGVEALPNGTGVLLDNASGALIGGMESGGGNLIAGNNGSGISIVGGDGNMLQGNLIGLAADGTTPLGNGAGIIITNSSGNVIGGATDAARNVISASTGGHGVAIQGLASTGNLVEGNYIGTDASGTLDRGNHFSGVLLQDGAGNTLRRNVISGNGENGVYVLGIASTDLTNLIEANYIGTDATGTRDLGNTLMGVRVLFAGPAMMSAGPEIRGNVVSGNDNTNIHVDVRAVEVLIEGNLIGTDFTGNARLLDPQGLPGVGVVLAGRDNRVIGNVISANPVDGINIDGADVPDGRATGNVVQGNLIGVALDGVTPLGNARNGVVIRRGASNNLIGTSGTDLELNTEGNVIAHNGQSGVGISDDASTGNTIRGNSIHSNGGLGIDLGGGSVTANDYGDPKAKPPILPDIDLGPNDLQNYPDIRQVTANKNGIQVFGQLHSAPETEFVIDFYASSAADTSEYGEGQRWLGSQTITTGEEGVGAIKYDISLDSAAVGEVITTTATNMSTDDTSEFSAAVLIVERGGGPGSGGPGGGNGGGQPMLFAAMGDEDFADENPPAVVQQPVFDVAFAAWQASGISSAHVDEPKWTSDLGVIDAPEEDAYDPDPLFADFDLLDELLSTPLLV